MSEILKTSRFSKAGNANWKPYATIGGIVLLIVGGYYLGAYLGWWAGAPGVTPTTYDFYVVNYATGLEEDDAHVYVYGCNIANKTQAEIDDLAYSDYSLADTLDSHSVGVFTPKANYIYMAKANCSGFVDWWFKPLLGNNTVRIMNLTEDIAGIGYSIPSYDAELPTTFAGIHTRDYVVKMQSLDATESAAAKATTLEGFLPYYDFENAAYNWTCIRIEYNDTAALSYVEFKETFECNEKCSANYTYLEINTLLLGELELNIRFASTFGTSFEVIGFAVGVGNADTFTAYDTQS